MVRRLLRRDFQIGLKLMPYDFQFRFAANLRTYQYALQFVDAADGMIIIADQGIALAQACARGRTIRLDVQNQDALRLLQTQMPADARMNRRGLSLDTQPGTADAPFLDQPGGDKFRRVDGNGKSDPLRRWNHGRVDPDDFAARIDQRSA